MRFEVAAADGPVVGDGADGFAADNAQGVAVEDAASKAAVSGGLVATAAARPVSRTLVLMAAADVVRDEGGAPRLGADLQRPRHLSPSTAGR